jgi:hypothetical protein
MIANREIGMAELLQHLRTPLSTIEHGAFLLSDHELDPALDGIVRRLELAASNSTAEASAPGVNRTAATSSRWCCRPSDQSWAEQAARRPSAQAWSRSARAPRSSPAARRTWARLTR